MTQTARRLWPPYEHGEMPTDPMPGDPARHAGIPTLFPYGDAYPTADPYDGATDSPGPDPDLPNEWDGRYQFISELHRGQSRIYLYRSVNDDDRVVIRQSQPVPGWKENRLSRFELERLEHPNIVRSIEAPVDVGQWRWEVLEYCPRGSLREIYAAEYPPGTRRGLLTSPPLTAVVRGVAEGLKHLRGSANAIHTDIKPDNLLVRDDDTVVIADFSTAIHPTTAAGRVGSAGRTPAYTPPWDRGHFTFAWDWAQLGLTLLTLGGGATYPAHEFATFDYHTLEPRLSLLIRGLLTPEPEHRWQYGQVQSWLAGENPEITGTDIGQAPTGSTTNFRVDFAERFCDTPDELGAQMAAHWAEALRTIQSHRNGLPYLTWLSDRLDEAGAACAVEVRGLAARRIDTHADRSDHPDGIQPDRLLARLVANLNPMGTPTFGVKEEHPYELTPTGLGALAHAATEALDRHEPDHPAVLTVERLFQLNLLRYFAEMDRFRHLDALDRDWHEAFHHARSLLTVAAAGADQSRHAYQGMLRASGMPEERLFALQRGDWEHFEDQSEFAGRMRAHLLGALTWQTHRETLQEQAAKARASIGVSEPWFAQLAGLPPPESPPSWQPSTPPPAGPPRRTWWRHLRMRWAATSPLRRRGGRR